MMYVMTVTGGWSRTKPTIHSSPRGAVDYALKTFGPFINDENRKTAVRFVEGLDDRTLFLLRQTDPKDSRTWTIPYISIVQAEVIP